MSTLVLMRHAEAAAFAGSDLERPLTAAGQRAAASVGAWLAESGILPTQVLVSAAERTRQTWAELASAAGLQVRAEFVPGLYTASPEALLDEIRLVDDSVETLMVVGHNPTVHYLAHLICDPATARPEALVQGFPPATVATYEVESWPDLGPASARLVNFRSGAPG